MQLLPRRSAPVLREDRGSLHRFRGEPLSLLARFLATFAALWLAAAPSRAHDSSSSDRGRAAAELGSALGTNTRVYYLDLFTVVARRVALGSWRELLGGVEQLSKNSFTQAEADGLYATVAASLPVVRVRWSGSTATLISSPPLEFALGVDRGLLVEIVNASGSTETFRGSAPGQPLSNAAWTQAGTTRAVLVLARLTTPGATQLLLSIHRGETSSQVPVPITVVQPATLLVTLWDADLGQMHPGRVWVRGLDGQFRQGVEFTSNSTLSVKKIPGSTPWCEACPSGNREYLVPFSYSSGRYQVTVPPGHVSMALERGFEHDLATRSLTLTPGEVRSLALTSGRFLDMRSLDWISGETHVHWVKNWWYENEDLALLHTVQRAEDIRVVNNLTLRRRDVVQGFTYTKPDHEPMGTIAAYTDGDHVLQMAEEFRNDPFYGHLNFLNLTNFLTAGVSTGPSSALRPHLPSGLISPIATGDLMGPFAEDYPVNYQAIDLALTQSSPTGRPIVVAAHGIAGPYSGEIPADIVLGRIDSADQVEPADYYRVLDSGLRLPLTDGADHPARLVGETRCYVKTSGKFSYGAWIDGIRSGATFVTSGPLLMLTVDGTDVGGEVQVSSGAAVDVHLEAHSRFPLGRVQVVSNGQLLYDQSHPTTSITVDFELTADVSRWVAARCSAAPEPTFRPHGEVGAAHTSAAYVVVEGTPIFVDSGAAEYLRDLCQAGGDEVWANGIFHAPHAKKKRREARDYFFAGRDAYQAIIDAHP